MERRKIAIKRMDLWDTKQMLPHFFKSGQYALSYFILRYNMSPCTLLANVTFLVLFVSFWHFIQIFHARKQHLKQNNSFLEISLYIMQADERIHCSSQ